MGVIFCAAMAYSLPAATWWRLLLWSLIGFALYFAYGHGHSRLRRDNAAEFAQAASVQHQTQRQPGTL
jgi:APA family basic amino acid/polyamine antiporter